MNNGCVSLTCPFRLPGRLRDNVCKFGDYFAILGQQARAFPARAKLDERFFIECAICLYVLALYWRWRTI